MDIPNLEEMKERLKQADIPKEYKKIVLAIIEMEREILS